MKIGILDQSPVMGQKSGREAILRTIEMAQYAEQLGYHRYWVAEQHASLAFASASPEVVASHILGKTSVIRVGVAGILVGHYAPIKVAENVNALSAISQGRFDFGIGRTPGATPDVINALGGFEFLSDDIDAKTKEVFNYLDSTASVTAVPTGEEVTERWILCGSVGGAARFAAKEGLPLAYAHFINPAQCVEAIDYYRKHFKPSEFLKKPYVSVALNAILADTDQKAQELAKPALAYFVLNRTTPEEHGFLDQQQADAVVFDDEQRAMAEQLLDAGFIGSHATVKTKFDDLFSATQCDEVTLLSIVDDPVCQRNSYQAIANMIGTSPQPIRASISG